MPGLRIAFSGMPPCYGKLISDAYDDRKRKSNNVFSGSDFCRRMSSSGSMVVRMGNTGIERMLLVMDTVYSAKNLHISSFSSAIESTFCYLTTRTFLRNLDLAGTVVSRSKHCNSKTIKETKENTKEEKQRL